MYSFTTDGVDLDIIGSSNAEAGGGSCSIKWTLELEIRSYGIKDIMIRVPDQTITTSVWRYDEETDEEYPEDITIELKDVKVENDSSMTHGETFPKKVEIYQGKATVEF